MGDTILKSVDSESLLLERSLASTVFGLKALSLLGEELPERTKLCSKLGSKKPRKNEIFQWVYIMAKLECPKALPPSLTKHLQSAVERPKLTSLVAAANAIFALMD